MALIGAVGNGLVENKAGIQAMTSQTIGEMVYSLKVNAPAIIEGGIALLEALVGAITENLPLIVETGAEIIARLVAGITTSMPTLIAAVALILPQIAKVIDVVTSIGGAVKGVVDIVSNGISTVLGIGSKLMTGIQGLFSLIMAHPVVAVVTAIIAAVVLLWTQCEEFRNAVEGIWEGIKDAFTSAWEAIKGAWQGAGEFFSGIVSSIKGVFEGIGEFLSGLFSDAWKAVKEAWSTAKEFFSKLWSSIKEKANDAASSIRDKLKEAWEAVKSAWEAAKEFFTGLWNTIRETAEKAAASIGDAFKKAWEAVKSAWDSATEFFRGIVDKVVGVFKDIGGKFKEIGGNIVNGLKEGISNAWSSFIGWISGKVGDIVSAVKGMLGIHSPSRVFAGIGENMALGLAEGWNDEYSSIKRQIENGMNFGTASVGLTTSGSSYGSGGNVPGNGRPSAGGNTTVIINSPVAVDAVQAAREWQKTSQRVALGLV